MPKELSLSPNQRVDLEDFEYGTRTFTVDSLRAHVNRLLSGPYHGGFVLEGFRVIIPDPVDSSNSVTVTNGIAIDRSGRLITFEEGNQFLNNPFLSGAKEAVLLDQAPKNYIMIEFTLTDEDQDDRAFWDPTFENAAIKDSGGDDVPQPKGKEVSIPIATRKAQGFEVIVSGTGFEDATDPNKLRIPIAIIPMNTGLSQINLTQGNVTDPTFGQTEQANTTIIEQPLITQTVALSRLYCANTRTFSDTGRVEIFRSGISNTSFGTIKYNFNPGPSTILNYIGNDRQNNILTFPSSSTDLSSQPGTSPQIGDIVRFLDDGGVPAVQSYWYLKDGSQHDCRPMFFSFTDDQASLADVEDPFGPAGTEGGDRRQDSRNNRHWSGVSLVIDPSAPTVAATVNYPSVSYGQQKTVVIPPRRVENRLKQAQDFFRVVATLMQEMKYGVAEVIWGVATEATPSGSTLTSSVLYALGITTAAYDYLVDVDKSFSQELVGSWVRFTSGPNFAITPLPRLQVVEVIGEHVLRFSASFPAAISTDSYQIEVNFPSNIEGVLANEYVGGFVDTRYTGSLQEVWNGRVDQFTDSYCEDLNQRLSANKVATITVGDGISTHGDFIGGAGLLAAFKLAYAKKRGATIYVREGVYKVQSDGNPINIGPNTTVVGEGKDRTRIELLGSGTDTAATPNYFLIRDYHGKYLDPGVSLISEITCPNITFKDLTLHSVDAEVNGDGTGGATWSPGYGYPLISNSPLDFFVNLTATGTGAPSSGVWRPNFFTLLNTVSLVDNFTLDNVRLFGGGRGDYTTGTDTTYSLYLVSADTHFTDYVNKNITFTNCTFDTNQGGGTGVLKSCENVLVEGCTFRNADPTSLTEISAPLEGLTFCSRSSVTLTYESGEFDCDGDVLITNCKFLGAFYNEASSATYPSNAFYGRGWINFTPTYLGQSVEVSSCIFRGDLLGDNSINTNDPRETKRGSYEIGTGVLNCSPFDISVTGCNFHTLKTGVFSQIGYVSVTDCQFWNMYRAVSIRPEVSVDEINYTIFSGPPAAVLGGTSVSNFWNWGAPGQSNYYGQSSINSKPTTYTKLRVGNCAVRNGVYGVLVGFYPYTPTSFTDIHQIETSIEVLDCTFKQVTLGGVYFSINKDIGIFSGAYGGGSNINFNWIHVGVKSCSFIDSTYAARFHGEMKNIVNDDRAIYTDIRLPISNFDYLNNSHVHCFYDGQSFAKAGSETTNGGAHTFIVGSTVTCQGNTFREVVNENGVASTDPADSYEVSPTMLVLMRRSLTATNNNWGHTTAPTGKVITALQVGLAGQSGTPPVNSNDDIPLGPSLNISGNTINASASTTGVYNGVYVGHVFPEGDSANTSENTTGLTRSGDAGILTLGSHVYPTLTFNNNDFDLENANFGFISVQHSNGAYTGTAVAGNFGSAGYSNFWEWRSASVKNNSIYIRSNDFGLYADLQYGNDIGTNLTTINNLEFNNTIGPVASQTNRYSFLGACRGSGVPPITDGQPDTYIACVDLRRCWRSFHDAGNSRTFGSIDVVGNTFNISGPAAVTGAIGAIGRNKQELMGLRISKFPMELNIKSNTFIRAPLLIKWSWNNPYHEHSTPRADSGGRNRL